MNISLSQDWLDKVSREKHDDLTVIGKQKALTELDLNASDILGAFSVTPACKEMIRRGWLPRHRSKGEERIREVVSELEGLFSLPEAAPALFRGTTKLTVQNVTGQLAVLAWLAHVRRAASEVEVATFDYSALTTEAIRELVQFSRFDDGPLRARAWLHSAGIPVVIMSSLPGMKLDGVSSSILNERPFIALTIRYDRTDSFWFTLLHEIGHVLLHLKDDMNQVFLDDLDELVEGDEIEAEANAFARDSFVPRDVWRRSDAFKLRSKSAIEALASKLKISPAIIAGRIRHETGNYRFLSDMVGQGSVRNLLFE